MTGRFDPIVIAGAGLWLLSALAALAVLARGLWIWFRARRAARVREVAAPVPFAELEDKRRTRSARRSWVRDIRATRALVLEAERSGDVGLVERARRSHSETMHRRRWL